MKKTLQQQLDDANATIARHVAEIATLKTERGTETGKADRYLAGLTRMKSEYADLKQQFDRAQGYLDRIREQETPPERRQAERRRPVNFDHDPFMHSHMSAFGRDHEPPKKWHDL